MTRKESGEIGILLGVDGCFTFFKRVWNRQFRLEDGSNFINPGAQNVP